MRKILLLLLLAVCSGTIQAQSDSIRRNTGRGPAPKPFADRLVFGGNIGLQFGTTTVINISPQVGYKVTDRFVAGVGGTYQYVSLRYFNTRYEYKILGYNLWSRYYPFENLFLHAEYNRLYSEWQPWTMKGKYWIDGILVGGGYRQQIAGNFGANILVLFNVKPSDEWPYRNPIIQAGFGFGF